MRNFRETKPFKTIAYVIITASLFQNLCGCGVSSPLEKAREENVSAEKPPSGSIKVIDMNGDVHETSVSVIEESEAEDEAADALPSASLAQIAQNLTYATDASFAYSELSESCQNCYREIYAILYDMLDHVELTSTDPDEIDLAFRAVMVDHPEIFYVKGYSIGKYMSGNTLRKIVFSGSYTHTPDEVATKREEVEAYVDKVIAGCPEGADDYGKIKYVYEYLIRHNEYITESENNQNILSVVEKGETVCQGYTKAMQLILNRMDVFCTLVNGQACGRNGVPDANELSNAANTEWGGHVWNIVKCNGMFYNVDVTWGDAVITLQNDDGSLSRDIEVNYEFFLVDDASLLETHEPKPVVSMPKCNSMEDNYYHHEGLYFTDIDPDQFTRAFESAYASGETYMFLKAASPEVFSKMEKHLFNDQRIFGYMGRTNVRYVEFPDRNLIMISL